MGVILPGRQGKAHVSRLFFPKLLFCQAQKKCGEFARASRAEPQTIAHSFRRECYRWPWELVQQVYLPFKSFSHDTSQPG